MSRGSSAFGLEPRQPTQITTERIDECVQRLVSDRFLFKTATFEDRCLITRRDVFKEMVDQRALSRPRWPMDEDSRRLTPEHRLERPRQGGQLRLPAQEEPAGLS